jgi:hypothetical protein
LIGMEDTGPQKKVGALDIEGAVGRPSVDRASKSPGPAASSEEKAKDEEMKDDGVKSEEQKDVKAGEQENVKAKASEDVEMKSED